MRCIRSAGLVVVLLAVMAGVVSAQGAPPAPPAPAGGPVIESPQKVAKAYAKQADDRGGQIIGGVALLILLLVPLELLVVVWKPSFVQRVADLALTRFGYTFAWGLASGVLLLLVAAVVGQAKGAGQVLSVLVLAALVVLAAIGLSGLTLRVGERLLGRDGTDRAPRPFVAVQAGAVVSTVAFLVPCLGTLALVVALLAGLGATVRALVGQQPPIAAPPPGGEGTGV